MRVRDTEFNVMVFNEEAEETVVMIHGIFSNLSVFYMAIAQELALRYRVVLYDMRGHGLSETTPSGYDLRSMSDDLVAIIAGLGMSKVHLAGYSFGGLVALYTTLNHPEVVDKLILIETPDLGDGRSRPLLDGYDRDYFEGYLQGLSRSTGTRPSPLTMERTHGRVRRLFEETTLKEDLQRDRDLFTRVAKSPFPHETLILYARYTECAKASKFLRRNLARARMHRGEGDHSIPVQNPGWISDRIIEFL